MQCSTFENMWITYGTEALPPAGQEHLKTCRACRAMIAETEKISDQLNALSPAPMPAYLKRAVLEKISGSVYSPDWFLNIISLVGLAIIVGVNLDVVISGIMTCAGQLTRLLLTTPWYFIPTAGLILSSLIIVPVLRKIL